jgi:hypothetical protein
LLKLAAFTTVMNAEQHDETQQNDMRSSIGEGQRQQWNAD